MKTKKLLLASAVCMVLGVILFGIGSAMGGNGITVKNTGLSFNSQNQIYTYENMDMQEFNAMDISVHNCPITVKKSDDENYGIEIQLEVESEEDVQFEVLKNTLILKQKQQSGSMSLDFSIWDDEDNYVIIYLPEEDFKKMVLSTSNGTVSLEDISAETINIETSNAGIDFTKVYGVKTDLQTTNGSVQLKDVFFSEEIKVDTSNNSITLELSGKEDDYRIAADTSNASIVIGGDDVGNEYKSRNGDINLELYTSNDKISVDFED